MTIFNWRFLSFCAFFAFQIFSLPYLGQMSFLRPAERSIANQGILSIENDQHAEMVIRKAQGILFKLEKNKDPEALQKLSHQELQELLREEAKLGEYENALVAYLVQRSTLKDQNLEHQILQLSADIGKVEPHLIRRVVLQALEENQVI